MFLFLLTLAVCSGGVFQHRVIFFRARPLEDCQRLTLRVPNSHCVHLRPGILQIGPRPHPVLTNWCVELEKWETALPGWVAKTCEGFMMTATQKQFQQWLDWLFIFNWRMWEWKRMPLKTNIWFFHQYILFKWKTFFYDSLYMEIIPFFQTTLKTRKCRCDIFCICSFGIWRIPDILNQCSFS